MMRNLSETLMRSFLSPFHYQEDVDDGVGELQEFDVLFADKEEVQVEMNVEEEVRNPNLNLRRSLTTPFPPSITATAKTSCCSCGDDCGSGEEATRYDLKQLQEQGMILEFFGDEIFIPPHVMVAMRAVAAHSMLEGIGRTLKGRDMINYRDSVLRLTGFIEN